MFSTIGYDQISYLLSALSAIISCGPVTTAQSTSNGHLQSLVPLGELASGVFGVSSLERRPFYLEMILFHILKHMENRVQTYQAYTELSYLLYGYLNDCSPEQQAAYDFGAIATSSFRCLWNLARKKKPVAALSAREALRFLMLEEMSSSHADAPITVSLHAK